MWVFLKRKHRKDDELAIIEALYRGERGPSNRQHIHTSIFTGHKYVREVLEGHELKCKRDFRIENMYPIIWLSASERDNFYKMRGLSPWKNKSQYSYIPFRRMQATVLYKGDFNTMVKR